MNNRKKRIYFTNQFKRLALINYSKGKKPDEIFNDLGITLTSQDKKYASKLLHRWRGEFYNKLKIYSILDKGFDENLLISEMENLSYSTKY